MRSRAHAAGDESFGDISIAVRTLPGLSIEASSDRRLCISKRAALPTVASALDFSVKLEGRCVVGARGGLSLTASS